MQLDPNLTAAELYELARTRPDLHPAIAAHPNAYPDLLNYLSSTGNPAVIAALAARGQTAGAHITTAGQRPSSKGMIWLIILLGLVAVIAVLVAVWALSGRGSDDAAAPPEIEAEVDESPDPEPEPDPVPEESEEPEPAEPTEEPVTPEPTEDAEEIASPCTDGEELIDGRCVVTATGCPAGIAVPSSIDEALVCGGIPADAHSTPDETITGISISAATFVTPSGNIGCDRIDEYGLACFIMDRYWDEVVPNEHINCGGFTLTTEGELEPHCRGDAPLWVLVTHGQVTGENITMPYDNSYLIGDNVCLSEFHGLTCWNPETAHGFFLSRESFESW